jgi:hypothetical protein
MVGFRNGAEGKCSKQNWAHWHIHANKNRVTDDGEGQSVIRIRRGRGPSRMKGPIPSVGWGRITPRAVWVLRVVGQADALEGRPMEGDCGGSGWTGA